MILRLYCMTIEREQDVKRKARKPVEISIISSAIQWFGVLEYALGRTAVRPKIKFGDAHRIP